MKTFFKGFKNYFSVSIVLVYFGLGLYFFFSKRDFSFNPYFFGSLLLLYSIFRMYRVISDHKQKMEESGDADLS